VKGTEKKGLTRMEKFEKEGNIQGKGHAFKANLKKHFSCEDEGVIRGKRERPISRKASPH